MISNLKIFPVSVKAGFTACRSFGGLDSDIFEISTLLTTPAPLFPVGAVWSLGGANEKFQVDIGVIGSIGGGVAASKVDEESCEGLCGI